MTTQDTNSEVARVEKDPNIGSISALSKRFLGVDEYHGLADEHVVTSVKPRHTTQTGV